MASLSPAFQGASRVSPQHSRPDHAGRATKRLKLVCPDVHEDLCSLLKRIESDDAKVATLALGELTKILGDKNVQTDNTEAFFHACGHSMLATAMRNNIDSETFQKESFAFLNVLCNAHKACSGGLKGVQHLVSQGIMDCCFDAIQQFEDNAEMAEAGLWVVSNLLDALRFDTIIEQGFLERTLQTMKVFSEHGNCQAAGSCILGNVADLPGAHRSAFARVNAISILALVFEREYNQDDFECKSYASRAMNSIVKLREEANDNEEEDEEDETEMQNQERKPRGAWRCA